MQERKSSYAYEDLLACARGELIRSRQRPTSLPADADVRSHHRDQRNRRRIRQGPHPRRTRHKAAISGSSRAISSAIRSCPDAWGSTRMWQMTGFFLGWLGEPGKGTALSTGEVKFRAWSRRRTKKVEYGVDFKRVMRGRLVLGIADGWLKADGETIYEANDLRVGLSSKPRPDRLRRHCEERSMKRLLSRASASCPRSATTPTRCARRSTTPNPASASPRISRTMASAARYGAPQNSTRPT